MLKKLVLVGHELTMGEVYYLARTNPDGFKAESVQFADATAFHHYCKRERVMDRCHQVVMPRVTDDGGLKILFTPLPETLELVNFVFFDYRGGMRRLVTYALETAIA